MVTADQLSPVGEGGKGPEGGHHWYQPPAMPEVREARHQCQPWGQATQETRCWDPGALRKQESFGNHWCKFK